VNQSQRVDEKMVSYVYFPCVDFLVLFILKYLTNGK